MKLVATMPLRNEAWIVGLSARAALKWCDALVVLLHASTDRTQEIIESVAAEHPGRVTILKELGHSWLEMEHRQRLLEAARGLGASHIAICDADEVLCGNLLGKVRDEIELLAPRQYLQAEMQCMWRALDRFRTDSRIWSGRRDLVLAFADWPDVRWRPINGGYQHHQRAPLNTRPSSRVLSPGGVMHLQWASWRRLIAKHIWYQMHERVTYPDLPVGKIANRYSYAPNEWGLVTKPASGGWWEPYAELMGHVDLNAVPWHEAESARLLAEHGAEHFEGLDFHGMDLQCTAR